MKARTKELAFDPAIIAQFPPSGRYLIGVSGGRDSVALFHRLIELGFRRLIVCHLDHQLRGRAAKADAKFVERLSVRLSAECELGRTDVAALARRTKQSVESAGRNARYQFFARIARRRRCRTIFLAHHADDLVETFLINLFRGTGPTGLSGIRQVAQQTVEGTGLQVVRPLLGIWRSQIDAYVESRRLEFREDETNQTLGPLRNRMRRRIIPYIEKQFGRTVRASIWRAATIAGDEADWLASLVDSKKTTARELPVKQLREQPRALQRRTIHRWLQLQDVVDLNFETIERVRALLEPDARDAKTNLAQGRHARRRAGKIFVE
jgi:tRNA(Ile)-lysidine synthase